MIVYGKMNFYGDQSLTSSTSITTSTEQYYSYTHYPTGQTTTLTNGAPAINYTSLYILAGGILVSGLTSAYDIVTGLDAIETKKAEIIKRNNIELNIGSTGGQNQINVGIKF